MIFKEGIKETTNNKHWRFFHIEVTISKDSLNDMYVYVDEI